MQLDQSSRLEEVTQLNYGRDTCSPRSNLETFGNRVRIGNLPILPISTYDEECLDMCIPGSKPLTQAQYKELTSDSYKID